MVCIRSLLELTFVCAEFEQPVERAEGNDGCDEEDRPEDDQHEAECPADNPAKIQIGEQGGEDNSNDAIHVGHIAFHNLSPLTIEWFVFLML
jgi:hypothetical protein